MNTYIRFLFNIGQLTIGLLYPALCTFVESQRLQHGQSYNPKWFHYWIIFALITSITHLTDLLLSGSIYILLKLSLHIMLTFSKNLVSVCYNHLQQILLKKQLHTSNAVTSIS